MARSRPLVVNVSKGVAPDRLVVCHMDGNMDVDYQLGVAETGVYLAYDCFGVEVYFDSIDRYRCHDSERERVLLALLEAGYADQLLLSQDIAIKSCLRRYATGTRTSCGTVRTTGSEHPRSNYGCHLPIRRR